MKEISISTAEKILNAAEKLFAEYSYNEVSIRQITSEAGTKLALVHYHFGSKEELYRTVIKRRIGKLSQDRLDLLNYFRETSDNGPISLIHIVEAFITPYLYNILYGEAGWRNYAIIISRLLASGSALSLAILQEEFDPGAHCFLVEIRRSAKGVSEQKIQWGFDFLVGSMCNVFAEVDRIKTLSNHLCSIQKPEVACQYLFNFVLAGLESVLYQPEYNIEPIFDTINSLKNNKIT